MDKRLIGRLLTRAVALLAVVVMSLTVAAVPVQAAPAYWSFKNDQRGSCLTAGANSGGTGKAYVAACTSGSSQDWDWVGSGEYKRLQSRSSGLCLMSDDNSNVNTVWISTCSSNPGQYWHYKYDDNGNGFLYNKLGFYTYGNGLRTSPSSASAVYSVNVVGDGHESYRTWSRLG